MGNCSKMSKGSPEAFIMRGNLHFCGLIFPLQSGSQPPAFTRFQFNTYYNLQCQYLRSGCNLHSHYICALSQFAFMDLN